MANHRAIGPFSTAADYVNIDGGTLCRGSSPVPGSVGLGKQAATYSYSISGTIGALGGMLFTEGFERLPGTWYDRTSRTTQFIANEAALGLSGFGDRDFRKLARRITANINAPPGVDVDIHFETRDGVENIMVRGQRGTRSFRFDLAAAEKLPLPKDADPFRPIYDTIDKILIAVVQVRKSKGSE